jgi:MarR family transcriptional regulator, transcriptional regulator for hemolysin
MLGDRLLRKAAMAPNDMVRTPMARSQTPDGSIERNRTEVGRAFGFLVHDVSRLIKRRFERRARKMGLPITRQQAAVVLNIAGNEGVSQAEVATWLGIEPIALVRMLDKLHEEGLVERRAHPTDRRVRTLWLTPAAQPVIERILAINEAIREEAFGGLPPATRDVLIGVLSHIKSNLALKEAVACDRSADSSSVEVASDSSA